jgi:hypothetical protein
MTTADPLNRWAWSGFLLVLFAGSLGMLTWTWTTIQSSSANFADTEQFAGNRLGAGTVDIAVGDDTVGFAAVNMAAGDVATGHLEVSNGGTLPLRFVLSASTGGGPLDDVLELVAWTGTSSCPSIPPDSADRWLPLTAASPESDVSATPASGELGPGESSLLCMRAVLPLSAPNSIQGQRFDMVLRVDAEHDIAATEIAETDRRGT